MERDVALRSPNPFGPCNLPASIFRRAVTATEHGLVTICRRSKFLRQDRSRDISKMPFPDRGLRTPLVVSAFNWFQAAARLYGPERLLYSFTGLTTGLPGSSGTGNSFAIFLLVAPVPASLSKNARTFISPQGLGLYAQLGWNVSRN